MECLKATKDQHCPTGSELRIVVVDNASTDDSVEQVRKKYPEISLLTNDTNLGGAGGFKVGAEFALSQGADVVWMLDNDAFPEPGCLAGAVRLLQSNPSISAIGALIVLDDQPDFVQEYGGKWNRWAGTLTPLGLGTKTSQHSGFVPVDYCPACSLFVRAEAIEAVGPMDDSLFFLGDDIEFGWRLSRNGFLMVGCRDIATRHQFWGDKPLIASRYYYVVRNLYFLFQDRMQLPFLMRIVCCFRMMCKAYLSITAFILSRRQDLVESYAHALRDYLRNKRGRRDFLVNFEAGLLPLKEEDVQLASHDRVYLVGFTNKNDISELLKQIPSLKLAKVSAMIGIHSRPAFVAAGDTSTTSFSLEGFDQPIELVTLKQTKRFGIKMIFRILIARARLAVIKDQKFDLFSFFAKTALFMVKGKVFRSERSRKSVAASGFFFAFLGLFLLVPAVLIFIVKSYLMPDRYQRSTLGKDLTKGLEESDRSETIRSLA